MSRGKRDITRTRRILQKILNRVPYKQIAFEEKVSLPVLAAIKSKYIDETIVLKLNDLGLFLMNEEQLTLPLHRAPIHRVNHRLRHWIRPSNSRKRPRKLV